MKKECLFLSMRSNPLNKTVTEILKRQFRTFVLFVVENVPSSLRESREEGKSPQKNVCSFCGAIIPRFSTYVKASLPFSSKACKNTTPRRCALVIFVTCALVKGIGTGSCADLGVAGGRMHPKAASLDASRQFTFRASASTRLSREILKFPLHFCPYPL